ncbi:porin precursor [Mycobacteroides abscessus subsp. abscessus]|nr:porin precursor [Mycobacteroides abscessus subsp. abscessus]SKN07749.1 porin precursor [Mycobacteroides abscessus subsp. abscessus]SLK72671.1 porin precursor [Mycobacteroides abscessus subsp. abscessus]
MKLLGKVSGWARRGVLAVGALLMTLVALIATTATAHAGLDDELTLVDGKGRLLRIQLSQRCVSVGPQPPDA